VCACQGMEESREEGGEGGEEEGKREDVNSDRQSGLFVSPSISVQEPEGEREGSPPAYERRAENIVALSGDSARECEVEICEHDEV